eukprot:CAMPEP_0181214606 /NCGR_PEP_ID=MMETSP1096-20121128/25550_1 /TAXON_ID=156174 ORGANISM="Chrysochromulina ericina, Strain CCMP281" /NCGR_SAMPLE_ID=MMETSP1096 /ASSEMBLY_ACC=CAM_ASM_000453 /LENGTH=90 /DNA_ID=CAMNT_0023306367 /DNA_START=315 /DNA_END=584 /DNA_ORIENTATION=-
MSGEIGPSGTCSCSRCVQHDMGEMSAGQRDSAGQRGTGHAAYAHNARTRLPPQSCASPHQRGRARGLRFARAFRCFSRSAASRAFNASLS